MLLTLVFEMDGERRPITFDGTPAQCQDQANAFIGDGLQVVRIIIFGEK
jgi:alkanesulfonate monooxygenase SsuD/methylene tetrahydromethanopterin reductase-like flavin-dependent oxidoreductase (luciferase family)